MQGPLALCTKSYTLSARFLVLFAAGPQRQLHVERVASVPALGPDLPVMRLYDRLRDGEPQTEAPAARPGRVGAGEALEDLLQLLRREGRALVFERKMAAVPPTALQLQPDGAAGVVFSGVLE